MLHASEYVWIDAYTYAYTTTVSDPSTQWPSLPPPGYILVPTAPIEFFPPDIAITLQA